MERGMVGKGQGRKTILKNKLNQKGKKTFLKVPNVWFSSTTCIDVQLIDSIVCTNKKFFSLSVTAILLFLQPIFIKPLDILWCQSVLLCLLWVFCKKAYMYTYCILTCIHIRTHMYTHNTLITNILLPSGPSGRQFQHLQFNSVSLSLQCEVFYSPFIPTAVLECCFPVPFVSLADLQTPFRSRSFLASSTLLQMVAVLSLLNTLSFAGSRMCDLTCCFLVALAQVYMQPAVVSLLL